MAKAQRPERMETVAQLNVGAQWDRLRGEFLNRWSQLDRQGLPPAEVAREMQAFMDGLSEKPQEDLAHKSAGIAYNDGRMEALEDEGVETAVRSAVMDSATCAECERLDGSTYAVGSPEYFEHAPPAYCLGGDRCRCVYIGVR